MDKPNKYRLPHILCISIYTFGLTFWLVKLSLSAYSLHQEDQFLSNVSNHPKNIFGKDQSKNIIFAFIMMLIGDSFYVVYFIVMFCLSIHDCILECNSEPRLNIIGLYKQEDWWQRSLFHCLIIILFPIPFQVFYLGQMAPPRNYLNIVEIIVYVMTASCVAPGLLLAAGFVLAIGLGCIIMIPVKCCELCSS